MSLGFHVPGYEFVPSHNSHQKSHLWLKTPYALTSHRQSRPRQQSMAIEVCTACSRPAPRPVLICTRCDEGVDKNGDAAYTVYCEKACRTKDEKSHQQSCKHSNIRKQLYRSGDLLQAIFYKFRDASFDKDVKELSKKNGMLHAKECFPQGDGRLFRFPRDRDSGSEDAAMRLTFSACTHACAYMYELGEMLFRGRFQGTRRSSSFD